MDALPNRNTLFARWIDPLHREMTSMPWVCFDEARWPAFRSRLRHALRTVTPEEVEQLLYIYDWRAQVSGSWLAALKGYRQFADLMGQRLVKNRLCECGRSYSLALARFAEGQSVAYLTAFLDSYRPGCQQEYDYAWALSALRWIDVEQATQHAQQYLGSEAGERLLAGLHGPVWWDRAVHETFCELMLLCETEFLGASRPLYWLRFKQRTQGENETTHGEAARRMDR